MWGDKGKQHGKYYIIMGYIYIYGGYIEFRDVTPINGESNGKENGT